MNIISLIPQGKVNAISRTELRYMTKLNDRVMRELIEQERRKGAIILNLQDGRGYYRPAPDEMDDVRRQYKQNDRRAKSILVQQKYLRRTLKQAGERV